MSDPAATSDKTTAKLTHRVHLDDSPEVVPPWDWNYNAGGTAISLAGGNYVANDIYEFSYTVKDPTVSGFGFAAIRDWVPWLRYEFISLLLSIHFDECFTRAPCTPEANAYL